MNYFLTENILLRLDSNRESLKRFFDVFLSIILLILFSPVFLVVGILIKLESSGPVIFAQKRLGKNNKIFHVYKFRSMYQNMSDISGTKRTVKNDSRVTKVGKFIRKTSIDELPQLVNVLIGNMSLVGPRPHPIGMMVGNLGKYEELFPGYYKRHAVKPGITGLAQIMGYRGEVDTMKKAKGRLYWDLYYINNYSFRLDLFVLIRTPFKGIFGANAY